MKVLVHGLPRTSSGKLQRYRLVEAFTNGEYTQLLASLQSLLQQSSSFEQDSPAMAQGPVDSPLRSYADVAEMAMPAVVNISTDKLVDMLRREEESKA